MSVGTGGVSGKPMRARLRPVDLEAEIKRLQDDAPLDAALAGLKRIADAQGTFTLTWNAASIGAVADILAAWCRSRHAQLAEKDAEIGRLKAELADVPTVGKYNLLQGAVGALEDANADLCASKNRVTAALHEARAEIGRWRDVVHGNHAEIRRLHAVLAERNTEIGRLQAELDATSDVPVEYVVEAGLAAAMAADPHREDRSVLRTTDGERKAWAWKAATREWELLS
jgi:hypothetical protein